MARPFSILAVTAMLLALAWPALAQDRAGQTVASLETHEARIERLITERLAGMVPSEKFIVRATVTGSPTTPERPALPDGGRELPGFRATTQDATPPPAQRYRIDNILVRVVVNEQVPNSDVEYLRTIVPILADFNTERGDRLELQVVTPEQFQQEEAARQEAMAEGIESLTLRDWILLGVLAGILLVLLIVMFRVLFLPKPREPEVRPVATGAPAPSAAQIDAEEQRRLEKEEKARQEMQRLADHRDALVRMLFARNDLAPAVVEHMAAGAGKLPGLIHALGPKVARSALMPHLSVERYQELEATVLKEKPPEVGRQIEFLREANLYLVSQELAHPETVRPDPFAFVDRLSRGQVAHLIKEQPLKVKALVLSRIDAEDTAAIIESLPKDQQLEVAIQIGNLQDYPLEMAENVGRELAKLVHTLPDPRLVDVEGHTALVDLMGRTSADTSRYLLQALKSRDTELADQVERRFFLFDSIPMVPDELLPQAVRTIPSTTVVQALQGADQDIQRKVIMAFPEQARAGMVNSLRSANYDEETIREARRQVVRKFQSLAAQGKIDLKQISDAWQSRAQAS
jgi:flagellar motor switch protein FliG